MDKRIKLIFISIIILIIIIIVIFLIKSNNKNDDFFGEDPETPIEQQQEYMASKAGKLNIVTNLNEYYTALNCIRSYFIKCNMVNEDSSVINEIYTLLDNEYINYKNITVDNLISVLPSFDYEYTIFSDKMLSFTENENCTAYFVRGTVNNYDASIKQNFNIILILDTVNGTYSLLLDDYVKDKALMDLNDGDSISFLLPKDIEDKEYNRYTNTNYSYNDYAGKLFNEVRYNMLYDKEKAYILLDNEFKNSNYSSKNEFDNFIESNEDSIYSMIYSNYDLEYNDGNLKYICYDTNDKYQITFYLKGIMEYTYKIELL